MRGLGIKGHHAARSLRPSTGACCCRLAATSELTPGAFVVPAYCNQPWDGAPENQTGNLPCELQMTGIEPDKLDRLHRSYSRDAELDEAFIVLTVGASLIATLGLLVNSAAVVIGAMVVAPWIMPLRAGSFAVLLGSAALLARSLVTLAVGVLLTTSLSTGLGLLVALPEFGTEVATRTSPNLLDLGIALVAGGMATYAKLRSDAVSSLAGTAIAVALVPPVCVMGLLLSQQNWSDAAGAGLLFCTNLLGILTGGLVLMACKDPFFREQLTRSHLSAASFLLTSLLILPLGSGFVSLLRDKTQSSTRNEVEQTIRRFLTNETITFGDVEGIPESEAVDLESMRIDWDKTPPEIRALVRVSDPRLPTYTQVREVQKEINKRQRGAFRLVVERTAVEVVGPTPPAPLKQGVESTPEDKQALQHQNINNDIPEGEGDPSQDLLQDPGLDSTIPESNTPTPSEKQESTATSDGSRQTPTR